MWRVVHRPDKMKLMQFKNIATYKWLSIIISVVVVELMELVILERKYSLFTGGFLQPYSFRSIPDRTIFLLLILWMNALFFGILGTLWFWIADRFRIHPLLTAYNFLFLAIASFGVWLGLKFEILSYFSDTLDYAIVKNLGGGSFLSAVEYIADETVMFAIGLVFLAALYWIGRRLVKRHIDAHDHPAHTPPTIRLRYLLPVLILVTIALSAWIGQEPQLRYGLRKTTAYTLIAKSLDELSDFDSDGHGLFWFPTDPDNMDASIYPGALDVPGNGLDEDGYDGDFKKPEELPDALATMPRKPGKHILLLVLESARADVIGKKWKGKLVAPNLTAMAINGSKVDFAYSHTGYTVTSLQALFNRTLSKYSDRIRLLDYLDQSGYSISIISGQDESFGDVATITGMNAPGHYYFDARTAIEDRVFANKDSGSLRLSEERVLRQFRKRIDEIDWNRPNFFYLNFQAGHFPYSHPGMPMILIGRPVSRGDIRYENREAVQATYWNALAVADAALGKIIEALKKKGVYEDTLILVLGDHGESLFDDGHLGHGFSLNEIQTRIPLIINKKGIEITQAVGQLDIAELLVEISLDRFDPKHWQSIEKPQFQFVGSLNQPQLVGIVSAGEHRTILDINTRKVYSSRLKKWSYFNEALDNPDIAEQAKQLVKEWEEVRWRAHLAKEKRIK